MIQFALAGVLLLAAAHSEASDWLNENGIHELAITPIAFIPTAKFDITRNGTLFHDQRFGESSSGFSIGYMLNLGKVVGLGIEGMWLYRKDARIDNFFPGLDTWVRGNSLLGFALLRLRTPGKSPVRGYVTGGVGLHRTQLEIYSRPQFGQTWASIGGVGNGNEERAWVVGRSERFAATMRLGIEYGFSDGGVLGFEGGWLRLASATYPSQVPGSAGASDVTVGGDGYTLGVRLGVRVGGRP